MWFWIILAVIVGALGFIGLGYGLAKTNEIKKFTYWELVAVGGLAVGIWFSRISLMTTYTSSIGRIGTTTDYLDKTPFYRALSTGENLAGKKFINLQNAVDEIFTIASEIQPRRGAFLRVTPTGKDLEIIEPNSPL